MANIGTAYVQIEPTAKGISGAIEKEFGSAGSTGAASFNKGFGSVIGGVGKTLGTMAAVGGAAVAAVTTKFVSASGEVAAYGDNIEKMSQKIGMSTDAYQQWDYVLKISGTEMSNMTTGLKTLTNKLDDAKNGSDTAVETFSKLGLSMDDLAGMSREEVFAATVTAFQGMADSTERAALANDLFGKSGQELAPLFNTTSEETARLMEEVKQLGGVMSEDAVKDSAAFKDQLTALQTSFQSLSRNMISEFLPDLTTVMGGLTDIFSGNSEEGLGKITEGISHLSENILSALPQMVKVGLEIVKALGDAIIANLPTLLSTAIEVAVQLGQALISALPTLISALISAAPMLIDGAMQLLMAVVDSLPQIIEVLIAALPDIITMLVESLTTALPQLISGLITLVMALVQNLPTIINALILALPDLIGMVVDALLECLPLLIDANIQLITALVTHLPEIVAALIQAIPMILQRIGESIITNGPIILQSLLTLGQTLLQTVLTLGQTLITNVGTFFQNLLNTVKQWLSQLPQQAAYFVGKMIADFINMLVTLPSKAQQVWSNFITNVKAFGQNLITEGPRIAREFGERLINALKSLPSKLVQIGKDIVEGLKNGIKDAWNGLTDWVKDLASNLIQGFKDNLKIGSPSKVFRDEIGQWIPAGIAEGIERGMGTINEAMSDMTMAVSPSAMGDISTYAPQAVSPVQNSNTALYELLSRYLPVIASGENVNVQLDVDGQRLFRVIQQQQARNTQLVGTANA